MKIIDLLNKIAEGKELPKKFMCKGHLYYRQKTKGVCYRCDELNEIFEECFILEDLNDTVEIIEEPKKIEKTELDKQISKLQSDIDILNNEISKYHNIIHSMRDRNNYMKNQLKMIIDNANNNI